VIVDGQVDRRYLEDLARQPALSPAGRENLVASFLSAVEFEIEHGRLAAALELAKRGVDAVPGDPRLLLGQAVVLIQQRELRQAREVLLRARSLAPNSAEVLKFLGFVEYSSDRVEEAIKTWKKAQALAPSTEVQQLLERAERETAAEERFQEASSVHFTLRFEGRQIPTDFRQQIFETLEEIYRQQERDLEVSPREPILVILYTSQAFYDVTQAPSWTGALNDGKIRVPLEGLEAMTPALQSVLAHEMVHTFVRYRSHGRCPAWLNEGLAQLGEGRSSARIAARLLEIYQKGGLLPLVSLNESFSGLDQRLVPTAYAQSLAVVEMLRDRESLSSLGRVLDRLAGGESAGAAVRAVFGVGLAELEEQVGPFLQGKAGR
jgi:tetratricopeptide (TPR) repeat protein